MKQSLLERSVELSGSVAALTNRLPAARAAAGREERLAIAVLDGAGCPVITFAASVLSSGGQSFRIASAMIMAAASRRCMFYVVCSRGCVMHCPVCNHPDTKVVDSRLTGDETAIRRRRECEACKYRFSTNEEVEVLNLTIVKRDGRREVYSRDKIERGLTQALEKRPVTDTAFRALVHAVERDIQRIKADEIKSSEIGEIVMKHLKSFDTVAYIRFASVYRQFADVASFTRELEKLSAARTRRILKKKKQRTKKRR